jgi:hypothetical protein
MRKWKWTWESGITTGILSRNLGLKTGIPSASGKAP